MKEETNATTTTQAPSEAQMNDMHKNAWLDFQADAQEAKKSVDRRYALMLETYGTYKEMPYAAKEMVKQDYAAHKEKWGENGSEQQKRFGVNEPDPNTKQQQQQKEPETIRDYKSMADEKEAFLNKVQQTREQSQTRNMEVER